MVNKHMKMCSTSHVIRELQITIRHHWIPTATVKLKNLVIPNAGKDVERETLILWWECKLVQPL